MLSGNRGAGCVRESCPLALQGGRMKTVEVQKCYDWSPGIYRITTNNGYSGDGLDGTYVLASEANERIARHAGLVEKVQGVINRGEVFDAKGSHSKWVCDELKAALAEVKHGI
jgi:hypothetical protein